MENVIPTIEEKFLSELRKSKNEKLFLYWNIFSILHLGDPDFLEHIIYEYKRAPEDSWWFINFHKALRQCDYFSNSLCLAESKITKEETQRLNSVLLQRSRIRREYEKNGINESEIENEEYINLGLELRSLKTKQISYERTSIAGHLDSILYECIRNSKDELFRYMEEFLKENVELDQEETI
jgi:hypothetical protein